MLFNSLPFLIFAPVFFLLFFHLHGSARFFWTIAASYFFYGWWDWRFTALLLASTCVGYFCGQRIRASSTPRTRLVWLWTNIGVHLSALFYFKYTNFFIDTLNPLSSFLGYPSRVSHLDIILPVGISFYTFTSLSYTIDIYRGKIAEFPHSFLKFTTYNCLFPHLVAGPVLRASNFLPQLEAQRAVDWARIGAGLELIAWGFFLKLCLADNASAFVDLRFARPELFNSQALVVSVVFFAFQIYADFSGYSLIAIGLARIMGYDFGINFNRPYFASNFSDFWQRWHISLSNWIRDYIYFPLGGSKHGTVRTSVNLAITMFLAGLWHGAGWTFVIWGLLQGFYLVAQRIVSGPYTRFCQRLRIPDALQHLAAIGVVFIFTCIGWVFFRAKSLPDALQILAGVFSWEAREHLTFGGTRYQMVRILLAALLVFSVDALAESERVLQWYRSRPAVRLVAVSIVSLLIFFLGSFSATSFIYFQF